VLLILFRFGEMEKTGIFVDIGSLYAARDKDIREGYIQYGSREAFENMDDPWIKRMLLIDGRAIPSPPTGWVQIIARGGLCKLSKEFGLYMEFKPSPRINSLGKAIWEIAMAAAQISWGMASLKTNDYIG